VASPDDHDTDIPVAPPRSPARLTVRRAWLRYMVPAAALVVLAAGAGLAAFETDTVESYWQGVWWSIALMTTVGWSGPAPTTLAGQLIAAFTMLTGFLLLAFVTAAVASLFVREDEEPLERAELSAEERILRELRELRSQVDALRRRLDGAD